MGEHQAILLMIFLEAIQEIGMEEFKKCSFFGSNNS